VHPVSYPGNLTYARPLRWTTADWHSQGRRAGSPTIPELQKLGDLCAGACGRPHVGVMGVTVGCWAFRVGFTDVCVKRQVLRAAVLVGAAGFLLTPFVLGLCLLSS
jgi:hypothetical protein